jgi:hypothetical protein
MRASPGPRDLANVVGFGVGAVASLWYLGWHGELPMTLFGFRAFSRPLEALGTSRFMAAGWLFVGVCSLEATSTYGPTIRLLTRRLPDPDDHPVFRIEPL